MRLHEADVSVLWTNFLSGGTRPYEQVASEFRANQPHLWNSLKKVDEEWFSAKTDHAVAYGTFVWKAIGSAYGPSDPAPPNLIEQFQKDEESFLASLGDESEFAIKKSMEERRRNFPEPILAAHIEREFQEGSAQAKELNPANNAVAVRQLLITIRALIAATRGVL